MFMQLLSKNIKLFGFFIIFWKKRNLMELLLFFFHQLHVVDGKLNFPLNIYSPKKLFCHSVAKFASFQLLLINYSWCCSGYFVIQGWCCFWGGNRLLLGVIFYVFLITSLQTFLDEVHRKLFWGKVHKEWTHRHPLRHNILWLTCQRPLVLVFHRD